MASSSSFGGGGGGIGPGDDLQPPKELLWPPNGYVFEQEFMLPAYCKPKLCPLKSVTLEKLEKMQAEAGQRLKELERAEKEETEAQQREQKEQNIAGGTKPKADIWRADDDNEIGRAHV